MNPSCSGVVESLFATRRDATRRAPWTTARLTGSSCSHDYAPMIMTDSRTAASASGAALPRPLPLAAFCACVVVPWLRRGVASPSAGAAASRRRASSYSNFYVNFDVNPFVFLRTRGRFRLFFVLAGT